MVGPDVLGQLILFGLTDPNFIFYFYNWTFYLESVNWTFNLESVAITDQVGDTVLLVFNKNMPFGIVLQAEHLQLI